MTPKGNITEVTPSLISDEWVWVITTEGKYLLTIEEFETFVFDAFQVVTIGKAS